MAKNRFNGTALSENGHAVYAAGTTPKRKETTAGTSVNLMYNGGNGYSDPVTFSGAWDN
jgi:hypothetical protein